MLSRREQPPSARLSLRKGGFNLSDETGGVVRFSSAAERRISQAGFTRCYPSFRIGERVLARWSDHRFYPACISSVLGAEDSYKVKFDDGFRKVVRAGNIRMIDKPHALHSKPVGRLASNEPCSGPAQSDSERRRRLVRRKQAAVDVPRNTSSPHTSPDSSSATPGVSRIGVLSESLLSATADTSLCEKFQSMGSCSEAKAHEFCSTDDSLREDEPDVHNRHSVAMQAAGGKDGEMPVNGIHLVSKISENLRRTSTPPCTPNGSSRSPHTIGEPTKAHSTAGPHAQPSERAGSPSLCNGFHQSSSVFDGAELPPLTLDSSSSSSHLSGELRPVLFPQIPNIPPLSPHHSPLHNRSVSLTDNDSQPFPSLSPSLFFGESPSEPPQVPLETTCPEPDVPQAAQASPVDAGEHQTVASTCDEQRHQEANVDGPPQVQKRRRRKITDAVLQPPPKVVAPKEVVPVADHNSFKCTVANCDKSFRKLNRLEYHLKYYHPECKRELEAVIRRQEAGRRSNVRKEPAKGSEVARSIEGVRTTAVAAASRPKEPKRPAPRRREGSGDAQASRVSRKPVSLPTTKVADDGTSTVLTQRSSADLSSPGEYTGTDTPVTVPVKRRRQSESDCRPSKRSRDDSSSTVGMKQDDQPLNLEHSANDTNGAGDTHPWPECAIVCPRRSLSFSFERQVPYESPPTMPGRPAGLKKLPIKSEFSDSDTSALATPANLPHSAVICCPCREDHRHGEFVRCAKCHCYQHLGCVPIAARNTTYCCPGCLRPSGLRKHARHKYASIWQNGGTLPWAGLSAKVRSPLGSQVSSLWQEADQLSWQTLMQSLSTAHDVGREAQVLQEVLNVTSVLLHHLRSPSGLKGVQRLFLPATAKPKPEKTVSAESRPTDDCMEGVKEEGDDTPAVKSEATDETSVLSCSVSSDQSGDRNRADHSGDNNRDDVEQPSDSAALLAGGGELEQLQGAMDAVRLSPATADQNSPRSPGQNALQQHAGLPPAAPHAPPPFRVPAFPSAEEPVFIFPEPAAKPNPNGTGSQSEQERLVEMASRPALSPMPFMTSRPALSPMPFAQRMSPGGFVQLPASPMYTSTPIPAPSPLSAAPAASPSPGLPSQNSSLATTALSSAGQSSSPSPHSVEGSVPSADCPSGEPAQSSAGGASEEPVPANKKTSSPTEAPAAGSTRRDEPRPPESDSVTESSPVMRPTQQSDSATQSTSSSTPDDPGTPDALQTADAADQTNEIDQEQEERNLELVRDRVLAFVEERHAFAEEYLVRLEQAVAQLEEFDSESCSADVRGNMSRLPPSQTPLVESTLSELNRLKDILHL